MLLQSGVGLRKGLEEEHKRIPGMFLCGNKWKDVSGKEVSGVGGSGREWDGVGRGESYNRNA